MAIRWKEGDHIFDHPMFCASKMWSFETSLANVVFLDFPLQNLPALQELAKTAGFRSKTPRHRVDRRERLRCGASRTGRQAPKPTGCAGLFGAKHQLLIPAVVLLGLDKPTNTCSCGMFYNIECNWGYVFGLLRLAEKLHYRLLQLLANKPLKPSLSLSHQATSR